MLDQIALRNAASILNCDVSAIRAVDTVESAGDGFLQNGNLKILFEGHWFYKFTKGRWATAYPTICYPHWTDLYYLGGEKEYERFDQAYKLDSQAAMLSASWGRYQIMGFNHAMAGYKTVNDMVDDYKLGESQQLASFCAYIQEAGLDDELRTHNWSAFAYRYNGASYKKNKYDIKLAKAYSQFFSQL